MHLWAKYVNRLPVGMIQFADNEIGKVCFTGAILKFRPLEDLLDMIEVTSRVQYRREGKILLFWQNK